MEPHAVEWVWFFTGIGVLVPLIDRAFGSHQFQKQRAQRILDHLVREVFGGDTKQHRLTLYRAVRGYRVWAGLLFHRIWRQDEKRLAFLSLLRVSPWAWYLYPWARPKKSINPYSCAAWRVFRAKKRDCEGAAGLVWQNDTHTVTNVQHAFSPGELRSIQSFDDYPETHPVRQYAAATNVREARLLRSRETYSRHFHGMVIEDSDGVKWGVMLLDSSAYSCPIPDGRKGELAQDEFRRYAELLSNILT